MSYIRLTPNEQCLARIKFQGFKLSKNEKKKIEFLKIER